MANLRKVARRKAKKYGLDPDIFERQIGAESGFNPRAVSPAGARGVAQIMPATARGWGVNPDDPVASLDAAAKNMARYVKKYGGYENALRAYNAGPAAIERSKGYSETNNYVAKILGGKDPGGLGKPSGGPSGQLATRQRVDQKGLQAAQIQARGNALLARMVAKRNPDSLLLKTGLLDATPPDPQDFMRTFVTPKKNARPALGTQGGRGNRVKVGGEPARGITDFAKLAKQMGLNVGEHPKYGGVAPVHATNSFHYRGRAIDVTGDPERLRKFANLVARKHGKRVKELFWRGPGWVNIDNGKHVGKDFVSGHDSHVHVAF